MPRCEIFPSTCILPFTPCAFDPPFDLSSWQSCPLADFLTTRS